MTIKPQQPLATGAGGLAALLLLLSLYALAVIGASGFFIDQRQSPGSHEWSYLGQHEWTQEHRQCALKAQSPIDIQRKFVIPNNHLKLRFYNYNQLTRFRLLNAHHTIKLEPMVQARDQFGVKLPEEGGSPGNNGDQNDTNISDIITADEEVEAVVLAPQHPPAGQVPGGRERSRVLVHSVNGNPPAPRPEEALQGAGNSLESESASAGEQPVAYNGQPTIKLDWLDDGNNEYKLRDIHFHWGERRDNGSEHALDGRRAAMEMHLVHVKHGLDKSKIGITSDSVTVIAVLIESYRKSNADFNPIVNALTRINMTNEAQEIEYKSISDLLPNILSNFYVYSGSLTTPPCYQVVNWVVMADRLYMNAKQLEMFRNLYAPPEDGRDQEHRRDREHQHPVVGAADSVNDHHQQPQSEPSMIMPNIRHLQPLNNRTILASFEPFGRLEQMAIGGIPNENGFVTIPYNSGAIAAWQHQQQLDGPLIMLVALVSFAMTVMPVISR